MNNVNFGMDGLVLDNTRWYNPKTGDSFVVRSNYFEDNNMMLQTTDGRVINMNQMNNYVQWQGKDLPPKTPLESQHHTILAEVKSILDEPSTNTDDVYIYNTAAPAGPSSTPFVSVEPTEDQRIISRVLSRAAAPKLDCKISWSKYPTRQLEMLLDFMSVEMDDVCNYYADQLDLTVIREDIKTQIRDYILSRQTQAEADPEPKETKKPNVPVPKKVAKK